MRGRGVVGISEFGGELVDERESMYGGVDVEPELLEGKVRRCAVGVFELGEKGLVVLT